MVGDDEDHADVARRASWSDSTSEEDVPRTPRRAPSFDRGTVLTQERNRKPAVRARSAQDALAYVERWRPGTLEKVRAAVPAESLSIVESAVRTEWIPLEHDRHLPAATIEVLGEADAILCWRSFLKGHVKSPLFRALLSGSVRMLGMSPATIVKVVPRGWNQAYRDVCHPRVLAREKDKAVLALEDMALAVFDWPPYMISFRAFFLGFFDLCGIDGELSFDADRDERRCEVVWRW